MLSGRDTLESDKSGKISTPASGFQYFQSAVCGYSSCVCGVAHYHCQMCGYGTSELSHTGVHQESCSRALKNNLSQSPCMPVSGNYQGTDHIFPAPFETNSELPMSTISTNSVPSAMQISNSSNHLYYRSGSQQSTVFNPLLSSQSQTLYSGVFGSQVGFSSQNNYPPGFNGFTHVDPMPWLSDSRMSSSSNSTPTLDAARNKSLTCTSQGISPSCCGNRVGGLLENMGLCSPLAADSFKALNKESTSCQHKSAISMENQNWFCGQSMLGYNSQVSGQGIQNAMYKCSEPFPSCTMSQLGIPLNEQDLKHSSICYEPNGISKQTNLYHNSRKSNCLEISREPCSKFSFNPKSQGHASEQHSPCMQSKDQENSTFDSQHTFGTVEGELHDEIYSQNSAIMQVADDRTAYNHAPKSSLVTQNLSEPTRSISTTHSSQVPVFSRCNLVTCDALEGYLQLEGQPLYQYPQMAPTTLNLDEDQVSNPGSCSGAAESDIVVEESEEEVLDCEISVEEVKRDSHSICLVCGSSNVHLIHITAISPVTSTTHIPVVTKLTQAMPPDCTISLSLHTEVICQRCLNLVETLDSLENKLTSVKTSLIELYNGKKIPSFISGMSKVIDSDHINHNNSEKSLTILPSMGKETNIKDDVGVHDKAVSDGNCEEVEYNSVDSGKLEISLEVEEGKEKVQDLKDIECGITSKEEQQILKEDEGNVNVSDEKAQGSLFGETGNSDTCNNIFPSKETSEKKIEKHSKSFNFFCDRCGRGFMQFSGLVKHLVTHFQDHRYQCEVCGKCFTQKSTLEDHLRKHRGTFHLTCTYCNKGFLYASSLRIHERTHTGERPYICQHCGKTFMCLSNLKSHLQLCEGEKMFDCSQCNETFTSSVQLKSHFVKLHESYPQNKCKVCGKIFMKPCDLKVHYRVHSGEKPHECSVCGKTYSSVGNLNQHAKKHKEERPFKCDLCGKGFLRKTVLERHKNQHNGERPFKCECCNKTFASAQNLHSHVKLHTGTMKKYTCTVCGKVMNHGLKVHMRTHSGDKPYSCSKCNSSFSVKSSLDKHIKLKHNEIT